jgi:hypothetical protein
MDTSVIAVTNNVLQDFSDIKTKYKMSEDEYGKALHFALLISEGKNKRDAYKIAVDDTVSDKDAVTYGSRFMVRKSTSDIIDRLITGTHILMADKHIDALKELYNIGMDIGISPKVRVEALSKFVDVSKRPDKAKGVEVNINLGSDMLAKLEEQLNALSSSGLLVTKSGDVIDVQEVINE